MVRRTGTAEPEWFFGWFGFLPNFPFSTDPIHQIRQTAMAKDKSPTKEKKKEPAKSLKEKRAAKQDKKDSRRD